MTCRLVATLSAPDRGPGGHNLTGLFGEWLNGLVVNFQRVKQRIKASVKKETAAQPTSAGSRR
jgi:hypothetical protein